MKIYSDTDRINEIRNPVITVGTFDGLHMGHQKILNRVNASAKELDGESVVLTFEPHPRKVLYPDDNDLRLINTQSEKIELMKSFEIEYLIICPFTIEFSRMTSVEFVKEILVRRIGLKKLIIGYDHHFGRNREGGLDELKEFSSLYDFEMEEVEAMVVNNVKVSSTKIRKLLEDGKVYIANDFLGYQYTIVGKVIDGDKIGSKIDFPTANIEVIEADKIIPKDGVYAVKVKIGGGWFKGMLNIGVRPTLGKEDKRIEVNIFGFDRQIYGDEIRISFVRRIRDEIKFENLDGLAEQLRIDKEMTLSLLK